MSLRTLEDVRYPMGSVVALVRAMGCIEPPWVGGSNPPPPSVFRR